MRVATLGSLALLASAFGPPPRQEGDRAQAERARAEREWAQAREFRDRAYEALAAVYAEIEAFFEDARSDGGARARASLKGASYETLEALDSEISAGRMEATNRLAATAFVRSTLLQGLPLRGFPEGLARPLAARLTEALRPVDDRPPLAPEEAADQAFRQVLDLERPFHESWNRALHREVAAAREFARAEAEFASAYERLERLVFPGRYHPAYASTPEGMVLVPGGTYTVGNNTGWDLDTDRTKRTFSVKVGSFYLDRVEVTNRRYAAFLEAIPAAEAGARVPATWPRTPERGHAIPEGREDHPATGVSYEDAAAFAAWAGCRLPTEDEWEIAARGPEAFVYPWGNVYQPGRANHLRTGLADSAAAGSFPGDRSPFGCFDMAGNVSEWTGTLPDGKPVGRLRENVNVVLRGGSFRRDAPQATATFRWAYPGRTTREADIGFRCAKDAPER